MDSFVYKWTFKPTLNWYVGFHKGETDDGYICSSRKVKDLIKQNPTEWTRTIVAKGTAEEMYKLETTILQTFDARRDSRSYNGTNNNGGYTPGWNLGMPMQEETKKIQSKQRLGKSTAKKGNKYPGCHSIESREKKRLMMLGNTRNPKGRPWSEARRAAQIARQSKAKLNIQGE